MRNLRYIPETHIEFTLMQEVKSAGMQCRPLADSYGDRWRDWLVMAKSGRSLLVTVCVSRKKEIPQYREGDIWYLHPVYNTRDVRDIVKTFKTGEHDGME